MTDLEYSFFQRRVLDLTGMDLLSYKSEQVKRRLNTLLVRTGTRNLFEYFRLISQDLEKRQEFRDFVTINVSEFFRIPDKFEYLQRHVLPNLMRDQRWLKVWSAGCSNGAEPYSLAIVLRELAPLGRFKILATDIDTTILEHARRAVYSSSDVRNLPGDLLKKYFSVTDGKFNLCDQVKNMVKFEARDLLRDEYDIDFDLIVCRHVIIYFTDEAKCEIFRKFHRSLRQGGVLFVGGTEMIQRPRPMGYEALAVSFYRKIGLSSSDLAETTTGSNDIVGW